MPDSPSPASTAASVKLPSQRRQTVALLVVAAVLAALMIGGVIYQQGGFSRVEQIYFIADDVTGVAPGTTVRMSGFRIGKVHALELQPDLHVKVVLAIAVEPFSHLRADARANLVREQLKPAAIDLRAGTASAALPAGDPRVAFGRKGTLTDIADDLRARMAPILDDIKQLTGVARERQGDIRAILENAHAVSRELAGTAQALHGLSTDMRQRTSTLGTQSEAAMAEANRSLQRLGGLVGQAEKSLDLINGRLPGLLGKTEAMLSNLDGVLRDSRTISAAAAAELPTLLRGAPPLLEDSRDMVQGLRQSWPVRSLLPAPAPTLLPIDSHDSAALREPGTR